MQLNNSKVSKTAGITVAKERVANKFLLAIDPNPLNPEYNQFPKNLFKYSKTHQHEEDNTNIKANHQKLLLIKDFPLIL